LEGHREEATTYRLFQQQRTDRMILTYVLDVTTSPTFQKLVESLVEDL